VEWWSTGLRQYGQPAGWRRFLRRTRSRRLGDLCVQRRRRRSRCGERCGELVVRSRCGEASRGPRRARRTGGQAGGAPRPGGVADEARGADSGTVGSLCGGGGDGLGIGTYSGANTAWTGTPCCLFPSAIAGRSRAVTGRVRNTGRWWRAGEWIRVVAPVSPSGAPGSLRWVNP
jgi:hypothetical protein